VQIFLIPKLFYSGASRKNSFEECSWLGKVCQASVTVKFIFLIQVDRIFRDSDKIPLFKPLKGDPGEDISTEGT